VKVKYKTKNIKRNEVEFFLATTNHSRAAIRSSRNFSDIATSVCIVWDWGSFDRPLRKIITVITEIRVKAARSPSRLFMSKCSAVMEINTCPASAISRFSRARKKTYLAKRFKKLFKPYKIFQHSIDGSKNTQERENDSKNRRVIAGEFVELVTTPDCNEDYPEHLEGHR
jgi:hypothetical protein